MVSRRTMLIGCAAAAAGAAAVMKPSDLGGPYPAYFARLNGMLREAGIDRPVLLIDLDRLDRNIDRVVHSTSIAPAKTYRIVVKSLPSPELIDYVARRSASKSFMVFHRPFLSAIAETHPDADILLGKPLPVAGARLFYERHRGPFQPARQLQWLIDSSARLDQYRSLAHSLGVKMRINLEIDVGLHRGGFDSPEALRAALRTIAADGASLEFAGFMGYDAHLMGLHGFLARREMPKVKQRYAECVALLRSEFPALATPASAPLCLNGAGSPTFRNYEGDALLNDLSAGSCLVKPRHYDIATLAEFEPAAYIASPVLKRLPGGRVPALEWSAPAIRAWDPNREQMIFAYGGNWLADVEAPPGVMPSDMYLSSNQQGYMASNAVTLGVDDFIFLRPTQSEAVLLQFGDLVAFRGGRIAARWPVLQQSV
ncbi:MAG TPA: alanine racemase [Burkholderiaceae bacterium]